VAQKAGAIPEDNIIRRAAMPGFFKQQKKYFMAKTATKTADSTETATGYEQMTRAQQDGSTNATSSMKQKSEDELKPLQKFFMDALKDVYWAEKELVKALQTMEQAATSEELREAFEDHGLLTQKHVTRLEKVFKMLGQPAEAKKCDAMQGLINEAQEIIKNTPEGTMTRDAALIIAAQKVEHYEIATYGGLVQLALTLGEERASDVLERTLNEEEETDYQLTEIAETCINFNAEQEEDEETEEEV